MASPATPILQALETLSKPVPITTPIARPVRKDLWPPETWAEMQRIFEGREP